MDSEDSFMYETPKATSRVLHRENTAASPPPRMGFPENTQSPSQRLKNLFFATYTSGGPSTQSSQKAAKDRELSFTSAALQTPTKTPNTATSGSLVDPDDMMDVDSPVAQRTQPKTNAGESHISEEDLRKPAVPLAINSSARFYSEHMRRSELRIELMSLSVRGNTPRGVYVMPSLSSINVWYGVMFVKRGYWRDAVVRFRIDIPREYPNTHPVITLMTLISHPLVRLEDGRFALEQQFPQWTPYGDFIFHALHYLKNAFKNHVIKQLQPRDCYNIGAYMKFKNNISQFREHARVDSMKSRKPEALYRSPPHDCPIVFSPLSDKQYESIMSHVQSSLTPKN
ncbi:hypothetical protein LPJ78_005465 [Coemansia sp. RSA 989]|nr:ubiquitin-conjugating enzyme/RWD-like protein [Coemansia mojavensis]KAJ1738801.1 hypothetical protein LPJ68_005246 [Coemansia sp. RSA 1086]KAJ1747241.1 hypothetical protein LPJ79_005388 [Coemansia sp. RSA 1821]KAJ1861226.1 hypothetical protein LPJ78_005465 [Coemansia sp. RSA 989]KAJ1869262.1 hypothetical protein LPJ55_005478 [Coemansia sp. RSA 990]KAJ2631555.1 hypothetical protein H4R22_001893 [Coemansia sp. RSA 1290]KAJ2646482.1 hypothetical protein IWW40_005399 [Coemansia sp. RSA 1250]